LLEGGFLGVDEVRPVVDRFEPQVIAFFELLGQERLLQPDGEDVDVTLLVAVYLDLLIEGQGIARPGAHAARCPQQGGNQQQEKVPHGQYLHGGRKGKGAGGNRPADLSGEVLRRI
jgi:hypothetical protein